MPGIGKIAKNVGVTSSQAIALFHQILEAVKSGEKISIPEFGKFYRFVTKERVVYSPQVPGNKVFVPSKVTMKFKIMPSAKTTMNQDDEYVEVKKSKAGAASKKATKKKATPAKKAAKKGGSSKAE